MVIDYLGGLFSSDLGMDLGIVVSEFRTQFQDQVLDPGQRFPGIGEALQIIGGEGMIEVIQIRNRIHSYSLSRFSISRKYLYVSTVSSPQAASSQAMMAPLCC